MTGTFTDNAQEKRFEYHVGGSFAFADYTREGDKLYINRVVAPQELRGTGAAGALMQHIVDHAKAEKLQVVPVCSYAVDWMRRKYRPQGSGPKP